MLCPLIDVSGKATTDRDYGFRPKSGISFRKTRRAERFADFDQAPDFMVPSEFNRKVSDCYTRKGLHSENTRSIGRLHRAQELQDEMKMAACKPVRRETSILSRLA